MRGALYREFNMLPGRILLHILIFFSLKIGHILGSLFTYVDNTLNHLNIGLFELSSFTHRANLSYVPYLLIGLICRILSFPPGLSNMSLAFVAFGFLSGCCSLNVWLSLLGISVLIISIIIVLFVSTLDRYYFYPYNLS